MRPALLFLVPSLEVGGAERVVSQLLAQLPRERFALHLALAARGGPLLARVPAEVTVHEIGAGRLRRAAFPLVRLVHHLRPRVVFSTLGYLNLALLALRAILPRDTRLVVREATTLSAYLAYHRSSRAWWAAYRLLYPRADRVVCPSQASLEDLAARFDVPRDHLRQIPNPVDAEEVEHLGRAQPRPYPTSGRHVLGLGRLAPEKGVDRLLEAFAELAPVRPDAQLWLVGDGPARGALEADVARRGLASRVHFAGTVANPYPWLRHADVFAQSSHFEGLPNALLEALACRTPAAAFDAPGGTREVLAGKPGTRLVPAGDASALARAIDELLAERGAARPTLDSRYGVREVVGAYERLFDELLGS